MDDLVEGHLHLVSQIVAQLAPRYPENIDRGELWSAGAAGLVAAARAYDPGSGSTFVGYASVRIRGAVVEMVRARDWTPTGRSAYWAEAGGDHLSPRWIEAAPHDPGAENEPVQQLEQMVDLTDRD